MKAYIQRVKGKIFDDWVFAAYQGLKDKGFKIKFSEFDDDSIEKMPLKDTIIVATVEKSMNYLKFHNIPIPKSITISFPVNQDYYLHRKINYITMGEFMNNNTFPIFVKPHSQFKEFSSGVLTNADTKRLILGDVPLDSIVMASEVIDIVSEYRCFVHRGNLVGIKHYSGDFTLFPDIKKIKDIIFDLEVGRNNNVHSLIPVSYTLDVGIKCDYFKQTDKYKTFIIEIQDFWSIGHYGLDTRTYSTMLRDRWLEIVRTKK